MSDRRCVNRDPARYPGKPDARRLLLAMARHQGGPYQGIFDCGFILGKQLGIAEKRIARLLDEWCDARILDCGTSIRGCWFTPEGWSFVERMRESEGE